MSAFAIDKLWKFLQSLSLTASNERWLAERLLESANAKTSKNENGSDTVWAKYQLSPEILGMSLNNRESVSDNIDNEFYEALEEKYR